MFNVSCENQQRTDERIPILLELPFKHKGIMVAVVDVDLPQRVLRGVGGEGCYGQDTQKHNKREEKR